MQKRGQNYFGYKLHTLVDVKHKFVRKAMVTDASVHDSNVYGKLTKGDKNDVKRVHADFRGKFRAETPGNRGRKGPSNG